ncbi:hypothetical protein [Thiothrix nivea]|uniref:hypothetical protein n=1 Tax=Thiothrix nivea TaxID=1031 RepID=UPI0005928568|nr:hypothetical protein [Thiothrix nivea]
MTMKKADVLIQAGHEGRTTGATGASSNWGSELKWTPIVADSATKILRGVGVNVIREDAYLDESKYQVKIAIFIHFDGSNPPGRSGPSIGYNDETDKPAADAWKKLYEQYCPFGFMEDNFTNNLKNYYGYYYTVTSDAELVLELGDLSSAKQAIWLRPRLEWLGLLIAHFIGVRLGLNSIPAPGRFHAEKVEKEKKFKS